MSRIGKNPVPVPAGVKVTLTGTTLSVTGPKGTLTQELPLGISLKQEGAELQVTRTDNGAKQRALHGTVRALAANMVQGVTAGYTKHLEIQGVGFKAVLKGKSVILALGYSHEINFPIPDGLTCTVDTTGTNVSLSGCDKQKVGQAAAQIRSFYKAEPYKGKGVRYKGEIVRRKAGKAVA